MSSPKKAKRAEESKAQMTDQSLPAETFFKGIFERDSGNNTTAVDQLFAVSGFPVAPVRDEDLAPVVQHGKRKSIFAQQFERSNLSRFGLSRLKSAEMPESMETCDSVVASESTEMPKESVETQESLKMDWKCSGNASDMWKIDEENRDRLAGMTEEQILAEQQEILGSSDPLMSMMASYLRSRKQKNKEECSLAEKTPPESSSNTETNPATTFEISLDDLPVKPKPEWVHMDKVEYEKIAWMKDLPPPSTDDQKTGRPARFDFSGKLLAEGADVPVHLGLHHHGEEPERAGYTLQELFLLGRSTNIQQRAIALTTIGRIIVNAKKGEFFDCLSTPVIPSLLDGGLGLLLRWALDESSQVSIVASIGALHALLVCEEDEVASDQILTWHDGCTVPSLQVLVSETKDPEDEEKQVTDAELVKKDVVKGLLHMNLPHRLRYVLEVCRPPASVVIQIMEILVRVAQNSTEAAYEVFKCPRTIDVIGKEFLPRAWEGTDGKPLPSAYGYPLSSAVRLMRVLCSAGRHIASLLLSKCNILQYVTHEPSAMNLPLNVGYSVCLESWRLWMVLLQYGLTLDFFTLYYPVVMEGLRMLSSLVHPVEKSTAAFASVVLGVIEATVHCAAEVTSHSKFSERLSQQPVKLDDDASHHIEPAVPQFSWRPVLGMLPCLSDACLRQLKNFTEFYFQKPFDLNFTTSSVNCLASYYDRIREQPDYSFLEVEREVQSLCSDYLIPCLKSQAFTLSLKYARDHSILNCEFMNKNELSADSLKTLGSLTGVRGALCPLLNPRSTVAFLIAVMRLLIAVGKLHHGIIERTYGLVLKHEEMVQYVRKVCRSKMHSIATNFFSRFENEFQYYLLQMSRMKGYKDDDSSDEIDMSLYHFLALSLLTRLHVGDEHLCHSLLSNVIFNVEFLRDLSLSDETPANCLEERLHLHAPQPLTSATQQDLAATKTDLIRDLHEHLPSLRSTYLTSAPVTSSQLAQSRNRWLHNCLSRDSLISGPVGQLLVPVDWVFLPLLQVHCRSHDPTGCDDESLDPGLVTKVTDSLRTMYLLETWRQDTLDGISTALKLSRIMCTFLAGSDLFLDKMIHGYLSGLLKAYCLPRHLDRMDFTKPIPGIASFHDLYRQLVTQYEAVSFGDSLFACYVLLPLQQCHSVSLRVVLWDEHVPALQSMFIPVKELLIPIERFLQPEESELHLIRLYFQAVFSKAILPVRCPVPYLIAVHHVNRFLYTVENKHRKLKEAMIKELMLSDNEELRHNLLYYKKASIECKNAIELYDELPVVRQNTLKTLQETNS